MDIELHGNLVGDYRDKRRGVLNASSDDPLARILYWRIARAIERNHLAADHYYAELVDHLHNAA